MKGSLARGEFATDPCRTLFQRVAAVFSPQLTDNCNVNVDMFGGVPVALTETTLPVRFDAETLQTLGHYAASAEVGGMVSIAHPHHDAARGCRFSYVVDFGRKSHYRLFAIPDDGSPERVVAEMPVDKPAYMHSFAMTERYLVLTEFPARRRSAAADVGGRAVHPQLSLAARARPALSRVRQGQRRPRRFAHGRRRLRLPPRQRFRGRVGSR